MPKARYTLTIEQEVDPKEVAEHTGGRSLSRGRRGIGQVIITEKLGMPGQKIQITKTKTSSPERAFTIAGRFCFGMAAAFKTEEEMKELKDAEIPEDN